MAGSVNKVILVGHLGKDPEMRYAASGMAVANFSMATSSSQKDDQGQWQDQTEWHKVVLFGKQAETAGQYLRKGSLVYIEGKLQTRKWKDKSDQDRYTTEIMGNTMTMLGARADGGSSKDTAYSAPPAAKPAPAASPAPSNDFDDDIPF